MRAGIKPIKEIRIKDNARWLATTGILPSAKPVNNQTIVQMSAPRQLCNKKCRNENDVRPLTKGTVVRISGTKREKVIAILP